MMAPGEMTMAQVQHLLAFLGYPLAADGIFGEKTKAAVRSFQEEYPSLEADGVPGEKTREALRTAVGKQWERPRGDFWGKIRYFKRSDPYIGCSCGKCGGFPVEPEERLMVLADRVREHFGVPLIPTSTVRCKSHNANCGGVSNSRHLTGRAMDLRVQGVSSDRVLEYVKQQKEVRYAYRVNHRVVHMDI